MVFVFYIAAIIAVLASFKVVTNTITFNALLYLVVSLLASAVVLFSLNAYLSAILLIILFIGAVSILFVFAISFINLNKQSAELEAKSFTPKVWLGPLILSFVLLVVLLYSINNTDYQQLISNKDIELTMKEMLLGPYILVVELSVLVLLGALVAAYRLVYNIFISDDEKDVEKKDAFVEHSVSSHSVEKGVDNDSVDA